jgi:hypothetical protein
MRLSRAMFMIWVIVGCAFFTLSSPVQADPVKDPQTTNCNANNPNGGGCPRGIASPQPTNPVCYLGEHVGNPHCLEGTSASPTSTASATASPTSTASATATATSTGSATATATSTASATATASPTTTATVTNFSGGGTNLVIPPGEQAASPSGSGPVSQPGAGSPRVAPPVVVVLPSPPDTSLPPQSFGGAPSTSAEPSVPQVAAQAPLPPSTGNAGMASDLGSTARGLTLLAAAATGLLAFAGRALSRPAGH